MSKPKVNIGLLFNPDNSTFAQQFDFLGGYTTPIWLSRRLYNSNLDETNDIC